MKSEKATQILLLAAGLVFFLVGICLLYTSFSEYFGFTDDEVDLLYQRYLQIEKNPSVTREGLELWYDGYQTAGGKKLYNPRSVVGLSLIHIYLADNKVHGKCRTLPFQKSTVHFHIGIDVSWKSRC